MRKQQLRKYLSKACGELGELGSFQKQEQTMINNFMKEYLFAKIDEGALDH